MIAEDALNCYIHGEEVGTFGLNANESCCACGGGIRTRKEDDIVALPGLPPIGSSGRKIGGTDSKAITIIVGLFMVISTVLL